MFVKKAMVDSQTIICAHCKSNALIKNGKNPNGIERWRCNDCKRSFQLSYRYNAHKEGMREKIIEMTLNSSVVRDIGRVLKISKDTVVAVLKKNANNKSLLSYYRGKKEPIKLSNRDKV